jgi:hypothetical protein
MAPKYNEFRMPDNGNEPATKADLQHTKQELRSEIQQVKQELRSEIQDLRNEFLEQLRDTETKLLTAFCAFAESN